MNNKTMKKYSYGNDNAFNEMKLSVSTNFIYKHF